MDRPLACPSNTEDTSRADRPAACLSNTEDTSRLDRPAACPTGQPHRGGFSALCVTRGIRVRFQHRLEEMARPLAFNASMSDYERQRENGTDESQGCTDEAHEPNKRSRIRDCLAFRQSEKRVCLGFYGIRSTEYDANSMNQYTSVLNDNFFE